MNKKCGICKIVAKLYKWPVRAIGYNGVMMCEKCYESCEYSIKQYYFDLVNR